jgi:tyrosine phenol-lyase
LFLVRQSGREHDLQNQSWAEPWRVKVVEPLRMISRAERESALVRAGYNTFLLDADDVYIDLLTDSGTSAMSDRQWAGMMMGDEAYAGSRNFYHLQDAVRRFYGYEHVIPTHQGRGAEHILSKILIKPGDHVAGNMYFTTTRAHQELAGATFHDVICREALEPASEFPFKGNVDLARLIELVERVGADKVPYISVAATVNMAGGQPISLENMRQVREYTRNHGIRIVLDATRAVENAWFIQQKEPGQGQRLVSEILLEMCSLSDGATMSGKKDSLVNIGGWLGLREASLADKAKNLLVLFEGLHTYGGLAGRDMEAMAIGIEESVQEDHIRSRIGQVFYLGQKLIDAGIPIVRPIGGHAVFLDAAAILSHIPREEFPAQALAAALYLESGIRSMERGAVSAGRDETGANRYPALELVRLTIPRRVYTQAHMDVTAESVIRVHSARQEVRGLRFEYEPPILRFFQARFEPVPRPVEERPLPLIIQGGMGVGVSSWTLARAVSLSGQLGVVSGTGLDNVLVRRLQDGDPDGHARRAMSHFPIAGVSERVLDRYFLPGGRAPGAPYKSLPLYKQKVSVARQQITILANFVEIWLAKEGHDNPVGINLLTKVQMPNLASLYGAMLAGVDYVLMGAGIPREIPGALDALAEHNLARIKFDVEGASSAEAHYLEFDPAAHWPEHGGPLKRPRFLPIISASSLATTLARKATGRVDGFVVEGPTAGGHNAPPRGEPRFNEYGEPIYGERDVVDLEKMRDLGLPFWLAGGMGSPEGLKAALAAGATGIQVGTLFAYCDESELTEEIRTQVLAAVSSEKVRVRTDPRASPTGYPFKVVEAEGMESQDDTRVRVCDIGYLRTAYLTADGKLGYRCSAEPVDAFVNKGGDISDTIGRRCLCNGLFANIGLPQARNEGLELPLVTSGDDLTSLGSFVAGRAGYSAADVIAHLLVGAGVAAV